LVFAKAMGKEIFPVLLEECSIDQVAAEHHPIMGGGKGILYKNSAHIWD
jgi:hypothetical protein